jgi:hypothetical protein
MGCRAAVLCTFFIHIADSRAITGPAAYLPKQLTALSTTIVDNRSIDLIAEWHRTDHL